MYQSKVLETNMSNKILSERLNRELDALGLPDLMGERVEACSKLFKLPKFQIAALLDGMIMDSTVIQAVAKELEVTLDWLLGNHGEEN